MSAAPNENAAAQDDSKCAETEETGQIKTLLQLSTALWRPSSELSAFQSQADNCRLDGHAGAKCPTRYPSAARMADVARNNSVRRIVWLLAHSQPSSQPAYNPAGAAIAAAYAGNERVLRALLAAPGPNGDTPRLWARDIWQGVVASGHVPSMRLVLAAMVQQGYRQPCLPLGPLRRAVVASLRSKHHGEMLRYWTSPVDDLFKRDGRKLQFKRSHMQQMLTAPALSHWASNIVFDVLLDHTCHSLVRDTPDIQPGPGKDPSSLGSDGSPTPPHGMSRLSAAYDHVHDVLKATLVQGLTATYAPDESLFTILAAVRPLGNEALWPWQQNKRGTVSNLALTDPIAWLNCGKSEQLKLAVDGHIAHCEFLRHAACSGVLDAIEVFLLKLRREGHRSLHAELRQFKPLYAWITRYAFTTRSGTCRRLSHFRFQLPQQTLSTKAGDRELEAAGREVATARGAAAPHQSPAGGSDAQGEATMALVLLMGRPRRNAQGGNAAAGAGFGAPRWLIMRVLELRHTPQFLPTAALLLALFTGFGEGAAALMRLQSAPEMTSVGLQILQYAASDNLAFGVHPKQRALQTLLQTLITYPRLLPSGFNLLGSISSGTGSDPMHCYMRTFVWTTVHGEVRQVHDTRTLLSTGGTAVPSVSEEYAAMHFKGPHTALRQIFVFLTQAALAHGQYSVPDLGTTLDESGHVQFVSLGPMGTKPFHLHSKLYNRAPSALQVHLCMQLVQLAFRCLAVQHAGDTSAKSHDQHNSGQVGAAAHAGHTRFSCSQDVWDEIASHLPLQWLPTGSIREEFRLWKRKQHPLRRGILLRREQRKNQTRAASSYS